MNAENFLVTLSGLAIVVIAIGSLIGTAVELAVLATWGGPQAMAIPTAVCFLLTGCSLVHIGSRGT